MRLTNKCPTLSLAILRFTLPAQVVKLVDTLASGASARKGVEVQVLSWAPNRGNYDADMSFPCGVISVELGQTSMAIIRTG